MAPTIKSRLLTGIAGACVLGALLLCAAGTAGARTGIGRPSAGTQPRALRAPRAVERHHALKPQRAYLREPRAHRSRGRRSRTPRHPSRAGNRASAVPVTGPHERPETRAERPGAAAGPAGEPSASGSGAAQSEGSGGSGPQAAAHESAPAGAPSGAAQNAATRTIPIGTAVANTYLTEGDPRYRETLLANFQAITPEYEMKWANTEPAQGSFEFGPADQLVQFAQAHDMNVRGHNLVWNKFLPGWLTSRSWTRAQLLAVLQEHIETVVAHFRGQVHEWDVVNEPFNNDGTLESGLWLNVIGPEYIALALKWAHQADPTARLFINDFNVDWPGPKEQAMLKLARELKEQGVPLDGIGMEEHLSLAWSPSQEQVEQAMGSFAALGLEVEVTEMDVETTGFSGSPAEAEQRQADVYRSVARACRATPACSRFAVWGVSDAVSWLGSEAAGLPFDSSYNPKPAWQAIREGLANP